MDNRAPPLRSLTGPRSTPPHPINDNRQPQPYRPSLLRQPDDPGSPRQTYRAPPWQVALWCCCLVAWSMALALGIAAAVQWVGWV